jgi:MoaA/NifB/PqqE/SkfB family radical SAM enzyme
MFRTQPIDTLDQAGNWTGSFRFEPFLGKWFFADSSNAARLLLLESNTVPKEISDLGIPDANAPIAGAYTAPIKIQIQINSNCNYHCPICYAVSEKGISKNEEMSLSELESLFAFLKKWGVIRVNFVGGEVFMRRDFTDIINAAHQRRLLTSCITNARIPGASIDRFQNLLTSLWNVQVSCNGVGKSYEEEYQTDSWERARECIRNVILKTRRNILSYVITQRNVSDIPEFLAFADECQPTVVKFGTVCWSGRSAESAALQYYQMVLPQAKLLIESGRLKYSKLEIQSQIDLGGNTPLWEEFINGYRPFEFYFAPEGRDGLYIQSSGDIYPFPLLSDRKEFCLGNIRRDSLVKIWRESDVLKRIRDVSFQNSDCGRLGCKRVCGLWGRSYAISWSGRFDGKVPCEFTGWK